MSALLFDRVLETSTTIGTGDVALAAAVTGYRRFSAVMSVGQTCPYFIEAKDANGNPSGDWEVGIATYSAANTLTRTTVEASSNAGAAVNFGAGTKWVALDASAARLTAVSAARIAFNVVTTVPSSAEVLALYPATDAFTIPANFSGSAASVLVNPTASYAIDAQRQVGGSGAFSSIGTITVGTGGSVTWATSSGTAKSIAANDVLKFLGDSDGDATFQGAFNIKGAL